MINQVGKNICFLGPYSVPSTSKVCLLCPAGLIMFSVFKTKYLELCIPFVISLNKNFIVILLDNAAVFLTTTSFQPCWIFLSPVTDIATFSSKLLLLSPPNRKGNGHQLVQRTLPVTPYLWLQILCLL